MRDVEKGRSDERGRDAGLRGNIREEKKRKEKGRKGKKERKKEKERKGKNEIREGEGRPTMAWPAVVSGGRSWLEKVAKAPSPSRLWGASVVKMGKMEFCKRDFGERNYSSLERALRGEEDGMVRGGQDGVGCGGDGGEGGFPW